MEGGTYIHHNLNKLSLLLLDNDGDRAPPVEFLPLHDDVTGVNYSRDETEDGEANVDEKVTTTPTGEHNAQWGKDQREDEEAAVGASHL